MGAINSAYTLTVVLVSSRGAGWCPLLAAPDEEEALAAYRDWLDERASEHGNLQADPDFDHSVSCTTRDLAFFGTDPIEDAANYWKYEVDHDEAIAGGDCVDWVTGTLMPALKSWLQKIQRTAG